MDNNVNTELSFNPTELARLTRLAVGSRKIEDFCRHAKLSRSFISKACNCSLLATPRKRSLFKLAEAKEKNET